MSILIFMMISLSARSQNKGMFDLELTINAQHGMVACFVPETYTGDEPLPLVIGMSPGSGPGMAMRDMLMPMAHELDFILACPDFIVGDGSECAAVLDLIGENYNIDENNVITTGYSAGGRTTFGAALTNPDKYRGSIGIAVASYGFSYAKVDHRAFAIICGIADELYIYNQNMATGIESAGGSCLFIGKEGVGHTGPYFGSPEFYDDWRQCWNYIQNYAPGEFVQLISPEDGADGIDQPVDLVWNKFKDSDDYKLEVRLNQTIMLSADVSDTTYSLDDLAPVTTYSWRVGAIVDGGATQWSLWQNFTTARPAPTESPQILAPDDGEYKVDTTTTFRWRGAEYAMACRFQAATGVFETPEIDTLIDHPGAVMNFWCKQLEEGKTYRWQVRGENEKGAGPWSEARTIHTFDPASVGENGGAADISVWPIPASEEIKIGFSLPDAGTVKLRIYDIAGRPALEKRYRMGAGRHSVYIPINGFAQGLYIYRMEINGITRSGAFIVD
ncbi:MAG: hypothetical protein ACLFQX_13400 [Candidatus Kapaibacterium sp.]